MMTYKLPLALIIASSSLIMVACGDSSHSTQSADSSNVSLRFSDAPVENAEKVVITVDKVTFSRPDSDIVVDKFTSEELGIVDADTFQIDLLEVQGNDNKLVLDSVKLPVGEVENLSLKIVDEDINASYVKEKDSGLLKPIKVPSDELKLGGFTVSTQSTQTFVVEFGLRQSMTYNPGPDRYILKPKGVRVVSLEDAATISGTLDLAELHLDAACIDKLDSSIGNAVYLYEGHALDVSKLGDVFISEGMSSDGEAFDEDVPGDMIAPAIVTSVDADGNYLFSYVKGGDYTLAFACKADGDDPIKWDGKTIPEPDSAIIELSVNNGESKSCQLSGIPTCLNLD